MKKNGWGVVCTWLLVQLAVSFIGGCAQIGAPTGGAKDTLAPVLVKSNPALYQRGFTGDKITLTFDEYIELQDLQNNLLISPLQNNMPVVKSNLRTVSISLKDSLLPNTTYTIQLGNAVKDINEGNVYKNLSYTFSTGNIIDSLTVSGKVQLAETGKADSTLLVLLYINAVDSSVQTRKPDYIARLNKEGIFEFNHLPAATVRLYALKDGDGSKTYNVKTEMFAFQDAPVRTSDNPSVTLYAFATEKISREIKTPKPTEKEKKEKKFRYTTNLAGPKKDLLEPLVLACNSKIKTWNPKGFRLTDTSFHEVPNARISLDSLQQNISIALAWTPETPYILWVDQDAATDEGGNAFVKADTIRFVTKSNEDYGNVVLRFTNIDLTKKPILQFVSDEVVKYAYPLTEPQWSNKLFPPGDYTLRILFDTNNDGIWTPGDYNQKRQPEKVLLLPKKLAVKANWDNEQNIEW